MSARFVRSSRGFSLIEVLVATALTLTLLAIVFDAVRPAFGDAGAVPETADVQQRLRASADTLFRTIATAGSGAAYGRFAGPLNGSIAAVFPYRIGRRGADSPGTVKRSVMTVLAVPAGAAVSTLADPLPARSAIVRINLDPACPTGDASCGFRNGMMVLAFDDAAGFDLFMIAAVTGTQLTLQHVQADAAIIHPPLQTRIVEIVSRTFLLKVDPVNDLYQLQQYDGGSGGDVPVADHVVDLSFDYQADNHQPLTPGMLSDGPWLPDGTSPNRYDADLRRIRAIDVTIRVESGSPAFRGPAGLLFARAGTSSDARRLIPDQVMRFQISPRNLNLSP